MKEVPTSHDVFTYSEDPSTWSSLDDKSLDYLIELRYIASHSGIYTVEKIKLNEHLTKLINSRNYPEDK